MVSLGTHTTATAQPSSASEPTAVPTASPPTQRRWSLFAGIGYGDAVCDNEKPDSDCPVDGAFTLGLGANWRFHSRFSLGGELAFWGYKIRDEWQGGLDDSATDVSFTSVYLAPHLRWHLFRGLGANPYLQAGIGIGSVSAKASNDAGTYEYSANGVVFPLAVGAEWRVGKRFRVGPQAQAYLQVSSNICSEEPGMANDCRSVGTNDEGGREGLLLPWRIIVTASYEL
jgi:opacity protein-like surface antigen